METIWNTNKTLKRKEKLTKALHWLVFPEGKIKYKEFFIDVMINSEILNETNNIKELEKK